MTSNRSKTMLLPLLSYRYLLARAAVCVQALLATLTPYAMWAQRARLFELYRLVAAELDSSWPMSPQAVPSHAQAALYCVDGCLRLEPDAFDIVSDREIDCCAMSKPRIHWDHYLVH